jgi:hypothetical protein
MEILLDKLKSEQRDNIPTDKKLKEKDLKRIIKYTGTNIFNTNNCILWKGFVTTNKGKYINFYFNGKKTALHRLLYLNFIGPIYDNQYLSFTCEACGECCNINHMKIKKKTYYKKSVSSKNIIKFDF